MYARPVAILAALVAFASQAAAEQTRAPAQRTKQGYKVETFAKGLAFPWGLAFLPDGRALVTERAGRLRLIGRDGRVSAPLKGVPEVAAGGQGGLLDVALSPDFAASKAIFISYAEPRQGGGSATSVARARLELEGDSGRLDDVKVIFRQQPATFGSMHFGSRLAFARDGNLFVTLGERGQRERAQALGTHYGKVVRIRQDGSVPRDNPFVGKGGVQPEIWSWGHRNVQAAAIHPATGKLWTVEHGARGGDEVNVPLAGRNYGWPVITYGRDYSGLRIGEGTAKAGMEQPVLLGPLDRALGHGVLYRQSLPRVEGQPVRRRAARGGLAPPGPRRRAGGGRRGPARKPRRAHPRRALRARRRAVAADRQPRRPGAAAGAGQMTQSKGVPGIASVDRSPLHHLGTQRTISPQTQVYLRVRQGFGPSVEPGEACQA
jgi:glucose/arabinose dehydrogenase